MVCCVCGEGDIRTIPPYWDRDVRLCLPCARQHAESFDKRGWPTPPWDLEAEGVAA